MTIVVLLKPVSVVKYIFFLLDLQHFAFWNGLWTVVVAKYMH